MAEMRNTKAHSDGLRHPNFPGHAMPAPPPAQHSNAPATIITIRHVAAQRFGDGNVHPNNPGKRPAPNVKTKPDRPAKVDVNRNKAPVEGVPPYSKEDVKGDGWTKAREKARGLTPSQ